METKQKKSLADILAEKRALSLKTEEARTDTFYKALNKE